MLLFLHALLQLEHELELLQSRLVDSPHRVVDDGAADQEEQDQQVGVVLAGLLAGADALAVDQQVVNLLAAFPALECDGRRQNVQPLCYRLRGGPDLKGGLTGLEGHKLVDEVGFAGAIEPRNANHCDGVPERRQVGDCLGR